MLLLLAGCDGGRPPDDTAAEQVVPACTSASTFVTWTLDDGATLAPVTTGPDVNSYTLGIAIDPADPRRLWAEHRGVLWGSTDAGCTWTAVDDLPTNGWALEAAGNGVVWGYAVNEAWALRIDDKGAITWDLDDSLLGLGLDLADPDHVRLGGNELVRETRDGGATWTTTPGPGVYPYAWAFDPRNLDHILVGSMSDGAWRSTDGGVTWAAVDGLGPNVNVFTIEWSDARSDVVWAEGLDIDEYDAGAANQGRHVWRSEDGGGRFVSVVEQGDGITLTNGVAAVSDPFDPDRLYFVFGTSFEGLGTWLYRYDDTTGLTTSTHSAWDGVSALAFSPATPGLLYLAVVDEQID